MPQELVFLKLGGSLITDKAKPATARRRLLRRIASEIKRALTENPDLKLILGHGSGSFGHVPANQYGTRLGVHTEAEWHGFASVWQQASTLNRIVVDSLHTAGLPAISFPPSSTCTTRDGRIVHWDIGPLNEALHNGLLPVVHGDVAFDQFRGGTIISTEDVFAFLAGRLEPQRILIAGVEDGVWADYPACTRLLDEITPESFGGIAAALQGSAHTDVTGGMETKVAEMLKVVGTAPNLTIRIFSGKAPGTIHSVLQGDPRGTLIRA